MNPTPPISVVTPFYNTSQYLAACIESVLAQTRGDFEYYLIDNQSTDGSADIAARYAARDARIRLIRNPTFLAQVANYNTAMRHAARVASYVKMVQADDALLPRCLEEMVALAEAHPSVAVVSAYRLRGTKLDGGGLELSTSVISGREICRLQLLRDGLFLFGSPTTILYRADVVRERDPFFEEGRLHEDTEVVYELLATRDFGFVHQVLTFSRMQEESISAKVKSFAPHELDKLIVLRRFGPRYLSDEELERRTRDLEDVYYRALADAWLEHGEEEFWKYHRDGLATIGEEIDRVALLRAAVPAAIRRLLRPGRAARMLARRIASVLPPARRP